MEVPANSNLIGYALDSEYGVYLWTKKQTIEYDQNILQSHTAEGAQWLSGRVLDSRQSGRGFEPHRRHCVVVLEQDTLILA